VEADSRKGTAVLPVAPRNLVAAIAAGGALLLGTATQLCASTTAFTFVDPPTGTNSALGNDGLRFTPSMGMLVTALGYYDRNQDGLALQHSVAIYDLATQKQIVSATVGPGATLSGLFRYQAVTPVVLSAGHQYIVVGHHPGSTNQDLAAYLTVAPTSAPGITYQGYYYDLNATIDIPTTNGGSNTPFFGPNFQFQLGVPEPGAAWLVVPGLVGFIVMRRAASGKQVRDDGTN